MALSTGVVVGIGVPPGRSCVGVVQALASNPTTTITDDAERLIALSALEADRPHDLPERLAILGIGRGHVHRVDHESRAAEVEDPQPVDLPRTLLITAAIPGTRRRGPAIV